MHAEGRTIRMIAAAAIIVGLGSVAGGTGGIVYTWQNAAEEKITTPEDAPIPSTRVDGPLSMWSQAEIIEQHQLARTSGLRYAEMPRTVVQTDADGEVVLDADGEPVMMPNAARASWIDATSLTTALNLGLLAYALSLFAIAAGATLAALGWAVRRLATAA